MLRKIHQVDIIVNNQPIELYDPEKLNLRINNVIFKPEEITSKNGEYSFSFEIPATPNNNKIFNFANNMSKLNKFNTLYDCEVNVDGINIFTGTLRLSNTNEDKYTCNLISIKVNKVEDIFGDSTMNELEWKVDFDGTRTISAYNSDNSNERGVYFPLVCYGNFQKKPETSYGDSYKIYTDLLSIDNTNRWFWSSFYPSFNLLELVRRLFASKGYTVDGDIFNDPVMKQIYLSTYLDSEQKPDYNYNKESIGTVIMRGEFTNKGHYAYLGGSMNWYGGRDDPHAIGNEFDSNNEMTLSGWENWTTRRGATACPVTIQNLDYGYDPVSPPGHGFGDNFTKVAVYDVFSTTDEQCLHWDYKPDNDFIYRHEKYKTTGLVTIPADGFYAIKLEVFNVSIEDETPQFRADRSRMENGNTVTEPYDYTKSWDTMPLEIQLVRNTDEVELIGTMDNYYQYPHEPDYSKYAASATPNALDSLGLNVRAFPANCDMYYVKKGETIAYDPYANEGFICGFTTMNESPAVIKNGKSWNLENKISNNSRYISEGYMKHYYTQDTGSLVEHTERSDYNKNGMSNEQSNYFSSAGQLKKNGNVECIVELKKNDELRLKAISRVYENYLRKYTVSPFHTMAFGAGTNKFKFQFRLTIRPYTPHVDRYYNNFTMPLMPTYETRLNGWGDKLNLGNFLNSKEKMSDFIDNFIKTFNLQYNQIGQNVFINKSKLDMVSLRADVDIDDRVNTDEATAEKIEYPGYMQVKWSVAEDEAGAYRSIDTLEHKAANNWKDFIDRGSDKIQMDTTNESKTETVDSKFSYTWYQDFTYYDYDRETRVPNGHTATFRLPLIAKDEDFIVQDEDSQKKDGHGLKQRLWFKDQNTQETLEMWNGEEVTVTIPVNEYNGCTLNFKNEQGSLLDRYFNVTPRTDSNYLTVECYLTPDEYIRLKNGAFTKFDDDLYLVSEVIGYDPSGTNRTELRLIKKV